MEPKLDYIKEHLNKIEDSCCEMLTWKGFKDFAKSILEKIEVMKKEKGIKDEIEIFGYDIEPEYLDDGSLIMKGCPEFYQGECTMFGDLCCEHLCGIKSEYGELEALPWK